MIPIALDPKFVRLGLAGSGRLAARRLAGLRAAGADVEVFSPAAEGELFAAAPELQVGLPDDAALRALNLLFVVGLEPAVAEALAQAARRLRVLVNVEDVPALCDFHSVAEVRRGDLLLTVSTNGAAPGLAGSIRRNIERCFGPEWDGRVREVAALRAGWRAEGLPMAESAKRIDALVDERSWVACPRGGR
jgi:precorrin-2 dehydrogenase/sirohydrochlorin ferrochelatase